MVGPDGALPLPWLAPLLQRTLRGPQPHALLLHGPQGVGQFELALTIAQAWLCEAAEGAKPCGTCASCRLVQSHSHPDVLVLLPEALQEPLGWAAGGDDEGGAERATKKAAPSREIKVGAVRLAVNFAQTTTARGRAKVVVLHPAERINAISANTLLKTLEEPPGAARFILSCAAPEALLPTIRSRCQSIALALPPAAQASAWLAGQGVADAAVLLAATGGQPQEALAWLQQGIDGAAWLRVPGAVAQGQPGAFANWPLPRLIDALQKVCHDTLSVAVGAAPRYFPAAALRAGAAPEALHGWMRELNRVARHADHPWNAGLLAESLVEQGRRALSAADRAPAGTSVHSAR